MTAGATPNAAARRDRVVTAERELAGRYEMNP
jgi:hypothetical protein